ncbi:hypothetical protein [Paenibacillus xylanexedens]|nr:hypothetical protein [Paenibacillus xylanexedens]
MPELTNRVESILAENNRFVLPSIEENITMSIFGDLLKNMMLTSDILE